MLGNTSLQGIAGITLFLITICHGQIKLEKTDDNNININIDVKELEKRLKERLESLEKDDSALKRNTTELEIIRNLLFGNNTDPKFMKNSNAKSLADAISDIDDKLNKDRKRPCLELDPPKPDFQSEGHRISEARCLDYIWDIKLEEERVKRSEICRGQKEQVKAHIINGHTVQAGDYPHMGAVGWQARNDQWIFLCGSSLISHKFVLTAAHCYSVSRDDSRVTYRKPKIVRFGVVNIKSGRHPVDIDIRRFISHPKYDITIKYYDIALIELDDVVRFTKKIRPACLWNKYNLQNTISAAVTGWGVTDLSMNSQKTSALLQVAHIDIIDYKQCGDMLKMKEQSDWWGVKRHQLCATKLNGTAGACEGDSGGPLQVKLTTNTEKPIHSVIAITSVGFGCGRTRFPNIYTRVSTFIDWIENEIWGVQNDVTNVTQSYGRNRITSNYHNEKHSFSGSSSTDGGHRRHGKHFHSSSRRYYSRNNDGGNF